MWECPLVALCCPEATVFYVMLYSWGYGTTAARVSAPSRQCLKATEDTVLGVCHSHLQVPSLSARDRTGHLLHGMWRTCKWQSFTAQVGELPSQDDQQPSSVAKTLSLGKHVLPEARMQESPTKRLVEGPSEVSVLGGSNATCSQTTEN